MQNDASKSINKIKGLETTTKVAIKLCDWSDAFVLFYKLCQLTHDNDTNTYRICFAIRWSGFGLFFWCEYSNRIFILTDRVNDASKSINKTGGGGWETTTKVPIKFCDWSDDLVILYKLCQLTRDDDINTHRICFAIRWCRFGFFFWCEYSS